MTSDAMWAYGLLMAMGYGFYRLIKWAIRRSNLMHEEAKRAGWRCDHIDEPNHDRLACYARQTTANQIVSMLPLLLLFIPTNR